jgi:hypothetical protein
VCDRNRLVVAAAGEGIVVRIAAERCDAVIGPRVLELESVEEVPFAAMLSTVSVSSTELSQSEAEYRLKVIEPVPSGLTAPEGVAVSLNVASIAPMAVC